MGISCMPHTPFLITCRCTVGTPYAYIQPPLPSLQIFSNLETSSRIYNSHQIIPFHHPRRTTLSCTSSPAHSQEAIKYYQIQSCILILNRYVCSLTSRYSSIWFLQFVILLSDILLMHSNSLLHAVTSAKKGPVSI